MTTTLFVLEHRSASDNEKYMSEHVLKISLLRSNVLIKSVVKVGLLVIKLANAILWKRGEPIILFPIILEGSFISQCITLLYLWFLLNCLKIYINICV